MYSELPLKHRDRRIYVFIYEIVLHKVKVIYIGCGFLYQKGCCVRSGFSCYKHRRTLCIA